MYYIREKGILIGGNSFSTDQNQLNEDTDLAVGTNASDDAATESCIPWAAGIGYSHIRSAQKRLLGVRIAPCKGRPGGGWYDWGYLLRIEIIWAFQEDGVR